jgi:hypothetical protein
MFCILREDTIRERRESYSRRVVGGIPSFCGIIKGKDLTISLVDVVHTGRTTYISVSIVLCIFCVLFPHFSYFIALRSCFSINLIIFNNNI